MSAQGFEAVAKYEYFCESQNKLIESVGCWALEEMLHLRAEAYFLKKQKTGLRRIILEWSQFARKRDLHSTTGGARETSTSTSPSPSAAARVPIEQREDGEGERGLVNESDEGVVVASHAISLEESMQDLSLGFVNVKDSLLRQTLEALETWNAGSEALLEVVEHIERQERDNKELLSTLQFGFQLQRVDDEKISSIKGDSMKTRLTIKLSRVIQNIKVLRLKAELLGINTSTIDKTLRSLEQQLAGGTPILQRFFVGKDQEDSHRSHPQGSIFRPSPSPSPSPTTTTNNSPNATMRQVAAARSYTTTTGDSTRTIYESAEDNGFSNEEDFYAYSENSYNSHLRSPNNVFGYHVGKQDDDTEMVFGDEDEGTDEEDSIFGSPREGEEGEEGEESSPFSVHRAKQLLHNLQSIKNVGKKLYY